MCGCSADDVYKLWRIFNAVAERTDDPDDAAGGGDEAAAPVCVHPDELQLILQRLAGLLRTAVDVDDDRAAAAAAESSNFGAFLRAVETGCLAGGKNAAGAASSAVGQMYDDIIANVLKKVAPLSRPALRSEYPGARFTKYLTTSYFSVRVINVWNSLPAVHFSSFAAFKQTIEQIDFSQFLFGYDN